MFSLAAIERMGLNIDYELLPTIISAPAQGVVAVCARTEDAEIEKFLQTLITSKPRSVSKLKETSSIL